MKTNSLKNAIAATSLLVALAGASSAQAVIVNETLGMFPPAATDVYRLTCPFGTDHLQGNVTDLIAVAAPVVSMQLFKPQPLPPAVVSTTDPIDGFQFFFGVLVQIPSPTVPLAKGSGQYYIFVDKNVVGPVENYRIDVTCRNAGGGVLATPAFPSAGFAIIQDQ